MAFRIIITDDDDMQLKALSAREQRVLQAAILSRLRDHPTTPTKAVKRLRANPVAEFELRVGDFCILYDVVGEEVVLLIVGRKVGNRLIVSGEEFYEHQTDPPQPAGGGPARDAG
jgi:mRNA-degrading endonuclease RelE of RelBE toxin-antitoxin system